MNIEMQKANLLADHIDAFIKYVDKCYRSHTVYWNTDKWYQIKLWIEEYKMNMIVAELYRINRFSWDEKYTLYLVRQFQKGFKNIEEYVNHHYHDLFLITGRLHTLKNLCQFFIK